MSVFAAADGAELAHHHMGEGEPLLVLPGGPVRASAYPGDAGGPSSRRRLVMLDLRGTGDSGIPADPATYRSTGVGSRPPGPTQQPASS